MSLRYFATRGFAKGADSIFLLVGCQLEAYTGAAMMTFTQTMLAFISAGLGSLFAASLTISHRQLCILISFAAGTLLGATFFHILPEAWESSSLLSIVTALASGYGLFYVLSRYVSHVCPACAASHFEHQSASRFQSMAVLLAIALTIHSALDGVAIVFGHDHSHGVEGSSIFLTIAIHKFPEGLALCALLLRAGYEKKKALITSLLLETSTIAGWVIGAVLLAEYGQQHWLDLVLVHIGGGFIYLALHAILNEAEEHSPRMIILFFLMGLIFMGLVS